MKCLFLLLDKQDNCMINVPMCISDIHIYYSVTHVSQPHEIIEVFHAVSEAESVTHDKDVEAPVLEIASNSVAFPKNGLLNVKHKVVDTVKISLQHFPV